ncbi:MAG: flavodoxin domain-containing protein [Pseudomonadota bacterium]
MKTVQILVGTTAGNTEYLADHTADLLQQQNIAYQLHYQPDLNHIPQSQPWLVLLASHGAGDYADSMASFYHQLQGLKQLSDIPFSVVAIGESCYDTYCAAGRHLDDSLEILGGKRLCPRLEIDMLTDDPENQVEHWLPELIDSLRSCPQQGS